MQLDNTNNPIQEMKKKRGRKKNPIINKPKWQPTDAEHVTLNKDGKPVLNFYNYSSLSFSGKIKL